MSRKLWVLNLFLLALAVFAGLQLRERWMAAKAREAAQRNYPVKPIPAPPFTAAPVPPAAAPANYATIAQKDLWDRSRNPDVPVEVVVPPPPPPKPPMPALPVFYGEMNIGGPMAILAVNAGSPQHATRPGEMIGVFKLVDVTRDDLTLEWDGQLVHKPVDELINHNVAQQQTEETATARTAAPPPPVQVEAPTAKGPGEASQFGGRICQPNDNTPFGTVQDGLRKTEIKTPFGSTCMWDPVGK